jgi:predicted DNA-binding transcriptional regulator YafY
VKNREIIGRQWRLIRVLGEGRGLSSVQIATRLAVSRQTVDRDLKTLRTDVGVAIGKKRVNGEVRHVLQGASLALAILPTEQAGLCLARHALAALEGTETVEAIKGLAGDAKESAQLRVRPARFAPAASTVLSEIERAMERGRRIRVRVRVAKHGGETKAYTIDPLVIRLVGPDPYLDGFAVERNALRTFKVARIEHIAVLDERAQEHPDIDIDALFSDAVKTWSGEETRVRVRIAPEAAWSVREYPLAREQDLFPEPDGAVIVDATVAGLVEVTRWVLSWGRHAEALEPPALRKRVEEELRVALERYGEREVRSSKVSGPEGEGAAKEPGVGPSSATRTTQVREEDAE